MQTYYGTLTGEGQLTIPSEVREQLRLKANDKVAFTVDGGTVRIEPAEFDLESVIGSVPALPGASADFEREIEEAVSDALTEKMRRWRSQQP